MSSRRSRSTSRQAASSSRISDQQIRELVSKLQALLPAEPLPRDNNNININDTVSASRVLEETCNYIRSLHKEVDDLSERLSELLHNTTNNDTDLEALIRTLLM